ncbi:hypothetical protein AJ80_07403 [Polytolypa hystricis UAMH7299]|uniref:Uncharacterized protein n=1 Tax=Polytolypa hystricis (strain UAMH7299) TaxID=1447883 RepID=A0A2B7XPQ3_POLH7|nr:hypothetical protein AJ80_07403 [Polytolypa hystricis UAMH7299]
MDMMSSPKDAAPAYEEAIQNHPVNQQLSASGSSRAYAAVPQIEIDESDHNNHGILHDEESHSHHDSAPLHPLSLDRTTPHFHCELHWFSWWHFSVLPLWAL